MRLHYWLLAAVTIIVVAGVVAYKIWGPEPDFQPASPVGLGAAQIFGKVEFKKNIFMQHGAMAIDDGPLKAIPCAKEPQTFAIIKIDGHLEAELSCVEDYLGGVKLTYTIDGEVRTAGVAQRDSDGGDDWDARSYLLRDKNGNLVIQTQTASSGEEIGEDGNPAPLECTMAVSAQIWEPESKMFVPGPPADDAPSVTFVPPINVATECLNPDGTWKGR